MSPSELESTGAAGRSQRSAVGRHLLADLQGIEPELLQDGPLVVDCLLKALGAAGFHVLEHHWHQFPGPMAGLTAFALLSESHAAVHTYPEYEYLALDVFCCGKADPDRVLRQLTARFNARQVSVVNQPRGEGVKPH
jgi:S-adenosylmethionine decarboxylase proenzyme